MSSPFHTVNLRIDFISHADATRAIRRWYYRPDMPVGKLVRFGAWENGRFCGCVIFGMGACDALGTRFGLTCFEVCEMVRVAFGEHKSPLSRIIAIALKLLKRHCPGLKAVCSFSDPEAGHVGTIYQAMGWIYIGTTAPQKTYHDKRTGEFVHSRRVSRSGIKTFNGVATRVTKIEDCLISLTPGKHRYYWAFDEPTKLRITAEQQPYPKRAGGVMLHAPLSSGEEAVQIRPRRSTPTLSK